LHRISSRNGGRACPAEKVGRTAGAGAFKNRQVSRRCSDLVKRPFSVLKNLKASKQKDEIVA